MEKGLTKSHRRAESRFRQSQYLYEQMEKFDDEVICRFVDEGNSKPIANGMTMKV